MTKATALGYEAKVSCSNCLVLGGIGTNAVKVGIGTTTPTRILTIALTLDNNHSIASAWTNYSSRRWKEHMQPVEGALEKALQLRGVTFDWKADGKHDLGMIAEEVGAVLPELVAYEDNGVDATSLDYARLTAVLVEAMKEQQSQIQQLRGTVKQQQAELDALTEIEGQTPKGER